MTLALLGVHAKGIAGEPTYYDALRLVAAMREDELMLLAISATADKRVTRGEIEQEDIACLEALEFPEVTDIAARRISGQLSAAEVTEAIAFFQGASGRQFTRRRELFLGGMLPAGESIAAADAAAVTAFKNTSAGRKLLTERITNDAGAMSEALARIDPVLSDCAYEREVRAARGYPTGYCESRPIASADHICLAKYVTKERSSARHAAEIEVSCTRDGRGLRSQIGLDLPEIPVALQWEDPRRIVILVDDPKIRIVSANSPESAPQHFRFAPRGAGDPPVVKCLPKDFDHSLASVLPMPTGVGAWRSYRSNGVCQMTSRVRNGVPGVMEHALLHFRQQKRPAHPFASTSLVFAAQLYLPSSQVMLAQGSNRMQLIDASNQQIHMLEGRAATSLLNALRNQPAQVDAKPIAGEAYAIPVSQEDFAFALRDFEACVKSL
jgi:hypothetical protein